MTANSLRAPRANRSAHIDRILCIRRPLNTLLLPVLALLLLFFGTGCATTAQGLYRSVWEATPRNIYDPSTLHDWGSWEHRYDGKLATDEDAKKAVGEMLSSVGDRYTYFMDTKAVAADKDNRDGIYTGVGIVLDFQIDASGHGVRAGDGGLLPQTDSSGYPIVKQLINGSPARKSGLLAGDAIVSIDGKDTRRRGLAALVEQLRGQAGSTVALTVLRDGRNWSLTVTRETVNAPAVSISKLPDGIGYLRLESFGQTDEVAEFKAGLEALKDCRALIIDVRGNLGGLVYNAVGTASFFIKEGRVVTIRHRIPGGGYKTETITLTGTNLVSQVTSSDSTEVERQTAERQPYLAAGRPVVILVNGSSASATELFTGAVKDHRAATVLGTRTYGKGIGQSNISMPNGTQLHVTSLHYFTPNGTWLGDGGNTRPIPHGIEPDVLVTPNQDLLFGGANDNQLHQAISILTSPPGRGSTLPCFQTKASLSG